MEINPLIPQLLQQYNINVDEGLLVLLGIYFKLDVDNILPEEAVKAVAITKIVERDYTLKTITWNIPLIKGEETVSSWNWVIDWIKPFEVMNKDRAGSWRDCISRMQKFFRKYPEYRITDVYEARNLYIRNVRSPQYLMYSHKFIFDGIGAMEKSTLLQYCEQVAKNRKGRGETDEAADIRGKVL